MKTEIYYIDRASGEKKQEQVYGDTVLSLFYGKTWLGRSLAFFIARFPFFSQIYGFFQNLPSSKKKIRPFIKKYNVNENEFLISADKFLSFNDFFIRKLKPDARPIEKNEDRIIIPADGRFLFYPRIDLCDGFIVKGQKFSLHRLINDASIAEHYAQGSLMLGRLCPVDYHRFHFPCNCLPGSARLIGGPLYSVNPIAVKQNLAFLSENKRMVTELQTEHFGTILYLEIGATNVGSIHQTYTPKNPYNKGDEKGFFSFGGSALMLLFEPNRIKFDDDLLIASSHHVETFCQMGQSMGRSTDVKN